MKTVHRILVFAAIMVLTACVGTYDRTMNALDSSEPVGSPFTKRLAIEYRNLAHQSSGRYFSGNSDSMHFARKALAAVDGVLVMPEAPTDWRISDEKMTEVSQARANLLEALSGGGRDLAPDAAAIAQVRFDCWISESSSMPCKDQFYIAMKELRNTTGEAQPMPAPVEQPPSPVKEEPKKEVVPVQQAMFLVFFDWNKYNLSDGAKEVLDAVTTEIKNRTDIKQVVIVGHTDTSGSEKYNDKLSIKRATAVRDYLVANEFPTEKIRIDGHGEKDLLVKTPDNVRQPENRRTQITLE